MTLALPPSEHSMAFNSAEQALARFDWMAASVALEDIPDETLTLNDSVYLAYLQARIAYARGLQAQALRQLAPVRGLRPFGQDNQQVVESVDGGA